MQVLKALTASVFALALTCGAALAQDAHHGDPHQADPHYVQHNEWHKGAKIAPGDWGRGEQVDWHAHHLQAPPRGYEWRQVDGNYVLAAAATGIIAATIIAAGH